MIADRVLMSFQLHKLICDDRRPSQKTKFFVSRDALRDASRWLAIIANGILTAFSYVGNVAKHTSATIADASRHMRTRLNQGSGWVYQSVENFKVYLFDYTAIRGASYIPTPSSLKKKEAIVNVKNDDEYCFLWSIVAALHPAEENPDRISNYRKYMYGLNRSS